jgi:hypothetical protein
MTDVYKLKLIKILKESEDIITYFYEKPEVLGRKAPMFM